MKEKQISEGLRVSEFQRKPVNMVPPLTKEHPDIDNHWDSEEWQDGHGHGAMLMAGFLVSLELRVLSEVQGENLNT